MKVLVTGATGFIGSHVADLLQDYDADIHCIARSTSNMQWLKGKPFTIVNASLSAPDSLIPAVKDAEMIIHVAGLTAAKNDLEFMRGNRDATRNLVEAAKAHAPKLKRFLHVSSLTVTGPSPSLQYPVNEDTPCRPITAYGISKKAAEEVVQEFMQDMPITIVRPPAVYGQRDTAVLTFFQTVARGIAPLIGFDQKRVSLIHGLDLASGIIEAAMSKNTVGKTYFVSSEQFYSWEEIARITQQALGKKSLITLRIPHPLVMGIAGISEFFGKFSSKPPVLNFEKGKDITQRYWICSIEKAKKDFGFRQKIDLENGIKQTVEWYLQHKWL
jgi:nucleoside-diphosphate-sugar epimerase